MSSSQKMQFQFDFRLSKALKEHLKQMCRTNYATAQMPSLIIITYKSEIWFKVVRTT